MCKYTVLYSTCTILVGTSNDLDAQNNDFYGISVRHIFWGRMITSTYMTH
jgi:hypothetical protein